MLCSSEVQSFPETALSAECLAIFCTGQVDTGTHRRSKHDKQAYRCWIRKPECPRVVIQGKSRLSPDQASRCLLFHPLERRTRSKRKAREKQLHPSQSCPDLYQHGRQPEGTCKLRVVWSSEDNCRALWLLDLYTPSIYRTPTSSM